MTTKGMREGAEAPRSQRVESEGSRSEHEKLAAAEAGAAAEARPPLASTPGLGLKEVSRRTARAVESVVIKYVLDEVRGSRVEAARRLQISYKALLYKIEMYQLGGSRPVRRLDAHLVRSRSASPSAATSENATPSRQEMA